MSTRATVERLEIERIAGSIGTKLFDEHESLKRELAESKAETVACLDFLGCEMGWEHFRAEQLYFKPDDVEKQRSSLDNARKLSNYLKDKGHGIRFLAEHMQLRAALKDAQETIRKMLNGEDANKIPEFDPQSWGELIAKGSSL